MCSSDLRQHAIAAAHDAGVTVSQEPVTEQEMRAAAELFVVGTTTDVAGIVTLDGKPFGEGRVGPITRRVQESFLVRLYGKAAAAR